jgi:hypothetical protein
MGSKGYKLQSRALDSLILARQELLDLWRKCPIPEEELLVNLGIYIRSSVLALWRELDKYKIVRSQYLPDRSYIIIE